MVQIWTLQKYKGYTKVTKKKMIRLDEKIN